MTVLVETRKKLFTGTGITGPFSWTWRFLSNTHILVTKITTATGERVLLTEGDDYTLTGALSYAGGSITTVVDVAVGEELEVKRDTPKIQDVDLRNQGDFFPETYEDALDKIIMTIQDILGDIVDFETAQLAIDAALGVRIDGILALAQTNRVTLIDSLGAAEAIIFADAGAGTINVNIPAANDPSAKPIVIVKVGTTENAVSIVPDTGTVLGFTTAEMVMPDEAVRLFPRAANNNWYRG
jgi:hypothetical protein